MEITITGTIYYDKVNTENTFKNFGVVVDKDIGRISKAKYGISGYIDYSNLYLTTYHYSGKYRLRLIEYGEESEVFDYIENVGTTIYDIGFSICGDAICDEIKNVYEVIGIDNAYCVDCSDSRFDLNVTFFIVNGEIYLSLLPIKGKIYDYIISVETEDEKIYHDSVNAVIKNLTKNEE